MQPVRNTRVASRPMARVALGRGRGIGGLVERQGAHVNRAEHPCRSLFSIGTAPPPFQVRLTNHHPWAHKGRMMRRTPYAAGVQRIACSAQRHLWDTTPCGPKSISAVLCCAAVLLQPKGKRHAEYSSRSFGTAGVAEQSKATASLDLYKQSVQLARSIRACTISRKL